MSEDKTETPEAETAANPAEESAVLTPGQIADLKTRAAKADENWDRLLRTTADFDNFKKRAAREKLEAAQYASASLLQKILPVLDNFESALAAAQNAAVPPGGIASFQSGVTMIQQQLKNVLVESGLEEIDSAGRPFDPNFHEAVSEQESADVPAGHVLQQLRKGYKLKERLLRPATVVVAKKPAAKS
ncbi:MAG: nucleotide exchange factor GrpE [Verrucomicrobiae bacterium]|nr:nucleotide exchange factor GrpE [Verrucomicrobiae bacterium]